MSILGTGNWINIRSRFFPSVIKEAAWIGTSVLVSKLYSNTIVQSVGGVIDLKYYKNKGMSLLSFYKINNASTANRIPSGKGKMTFSDGSLYIGEFIHGMPTGRGKLIFTNGDVYEGDIIDGKAQGKGKLSFGNGHVWEGDLINGIPIGEGKLSFGNGFIWEGELTNGIPTGKGKLSVGSDYIWEGELINGVQSEYGKLSLRDKYVYEGTLVAGVPSGKGKMTYASGNIYEGDFVNGTPSGKGCLKFHDGDIYEGDFINCLPFGKGKMVYTDGTMYEGDFVNGRMNTDISHLGDQQFFNFVCRLSRKGSTPSYSLGIMSDYLQKKGYRDLGLALDSAFKLLLIDPDEQKKESEKIYNALNEGLPQLFSYGFQNHGMGLNLLPDSFPGLVICEIFNSGSGLAAFHQKHETDFRKYKTMLQIKVPIGSLTADKILSFLSLKFKNKEEAYRAILDLPGAEMIPSDLAPWQTSQKAAECSFRWILAYLKNKMSIEEYKKMLSDLRFDCEAAYRNKNPHANFLTDQSYRKDKQTFPDGSSYEGDFVYGTFHGQGKLVFADGSYYEGDFFDGKYHGKGKRVWADGRCYEGDYDQGKCQGQGKEVWPNGNCYEGDFFKGVYHGKGRYIFSNGDIYEGSFIDDHFHGYGEMTYFDGTFLKGEFFKDKLINNYDIFQLVDRLFFKVFHR